MTYWLTVFVIVATVCLVAITSAVLYHLWLDALERKDRRR